MRHTTIKDVAQALNVSISTISRAFNDKYDIKKETREKILRKAEEMGYVPNPLAKRLGQNTSATIGVVVPEFRNAFYSEVIMGIQEHFIGLGYQVLIMQCDGDPEQERKNIETLFLNKVDGIIISPTIGSLSMEFCLKQYKNGFPVVFLNRVTESLNAPKVLFNNQKWSYFATEHLIREGHKRIYYLSGSPELPLSQERIKGFKKALKKHQLPLSDQKIIPTGFTAEKGMETIEDLIYQQDLPDAIYCANDWVAFGVLKKLREHGYSIPNDIAIFGFTETPMSQLISPPLSSVTQPTFTMGQVAGKMLWEQIEDKALNSLTVVLNGKLNIRQSSQGNSKQTT